MRGAGLKDRNKPYCVSVNPVYSSFTWTGINPHVMAMRSGGMKNKSREYARMVVRNTQPFVLRIVLRSMMLEQ